MLTIGVSGCSNEESSWKNAQSKNTISAYEEFLKRYPQSKFLNEARSKIAKLPTFAKVIINFPTSLQRRDSYHNIGGPVWVFNIDFDEVNGISAEITQKLMRIYDNNGNVWGDEYFKPITDSETQQDVTIKLEPHGDGSYTAWVNDTGSPCQFCGAKMVLQYTGVDENGNEVNSEVSFILM